MVDTVEKIKSKMKESDGFLIGALLALYSYQTTDEKEYKGTAHINGRGFNKVDAFILSDMAEHYKKSGWLSPKQITFVRMKLVKYATQLVGVDIPDCEIKERQKKPEAPKTGKFIKIGQDGDTIEVHFDYDPSMVTIIRGFFDRKWNPKGKFWTVPLTKDNIDNLKDVGFEVKDNLNEWIESLDKVTEVELPKELSDRLYPFQREGVAQIEKWNGNCILGDEMGLGKTIQAIAWARIHPELRPMVCVIPASVKLNWAREFGKWSPEDKVYVMSGRKTTVPNGYDVYVINYDILQYHLEGLMNLNIKIMVLDECHFIKNPQAKRTRACLEMGKKSLHVIPISGTPAVNRPIEIFNAIKLVKPKLFTSRWKFAHRYCGAKHNGFGWDFNGASNIEELHKLLKESIMIRRLKSEVLPDLPDKIRSVIPLEIDNESEYREAERDLIGWLRGIDPEKAGKAEKAEALVRFGALKQLAVKGKLTAAKKWIDDFMEGGDKVVLFAWHKKVIDSIMTEYKGQIVKIDGSVPPSQRLEIQDQFNQDETIRLFMGQIKAAGVGLTLTAAPATVTLELGWTPGDHDQCEDRIHRIGQEADKVLAYYLIAVGTIEEDIVKLIETKRQNLSQLLDGKDVEEDESILQGLWKAMRERE